MYRGVVLLAANDQFFQIQLHQMLKIGVELLFREIGEEFGLGAFVDFSKQNDVPLQVMVWPHLVDIEGSREISSKVAGFFRKEEIPVFEIAGVAAKVPLEERIVNSLDVHPSERVHSMVAAQLFRDHKDFFDTRSGEAGASQPAP